MQPSPPNLDTLTALHSDHRLATLPSLDPLRVFPQTHAHPPSHKREAFGGSGFIVGSTATPASSDHSGPPLSSVLAPIVFGIPKLVNRVSMPGFQYIHILDTTIGRAPAPNLLAEVVPDPSKQRAVLPN